MKSMPDGIKKLKIIQKSTFFLFFVVPLLRLSWYNIIVKSNERSFKKNEHG